MNPVLEYMTSVEDDLRERLTDSASASGRVHVLFNADNAETQQKEEVSEEASRSSSNVSKSSNASWVRYATLNPSNSTASTTDSEAVNAQLSELFRQAEEEIFESGVETEFSRKLLALINKHGSVAMDAITDFILSGSINPEIAAETMRWLGLMESPVCYTQRRWLLARCLRDSSERVRDAASLGLSYLNHSWAIPYLENAIRDEQIPELRHDMEQVLEQLKYTSENSHGLPKRNIDRLV